MACQKRAARARLVTGVRPAGKMGRQGREKVVEAREGGGQQEV
jgi:hypothetical protein